MNRLSLFAATLKEGEAALILSSVSRRYLSGFSSSDGALLVTPSESVLLLDPRYFEMACIRREQGRMPQELQLSPKRLRDFFLPFLLQRKIHTVLLEDRRLVVSEWERLKTSYPELSFVPLGDRIETMRHIKTQEEIASIRTSQALAEEAYTYVLERLEPGRTETEIALEIEAYMKKHGAEEIAFPTICLSGEHTSMPHGRPQPVPMQKNAFVTMDFGCVLDGYASDMTRTVVLGKANEEMKRVYQTVLDAQEAALKAVRAGVLGQEVDAAARNVIAAAGYGDAFGHSTGHGVGLEVHEGPAFSPAFDSAIPAGAVISVEPGIYLTGRFGVRIEDLAVVCEDGYENLNHSTKQLLEL